MTAVLTPVVDMERGMRGNELIYTSARGWLRRGEAAVAEGLNRQGPGSGRSGNWLADETSG